MTWLAFRLLRPFLITAAVLAAASTAVVLHGAAVVRRQLDDAGLSGCLDPNFCYPDGAALDAVFRMEVAAAVVPSLVGLILGVALFAREVESDAVAFTLTQSISRRRWLFTSFGVALGAGLACTLLVAGVHRFVATRYTVLASDTYELLQLLHLNNIGFMLALTALPIALGGVIGLSTGSTLRTLVLTVISAPLAILSAALVAAVLLTLAMRVLAIPSSGGESSGSFTDDLYTLDPLAYLIGVVAGAAVLGLVLLSPRIADRRLR